MNEQQLELTRLLGKKEFNSENLWWFLLLIPDCKYNNWLVSLSGYEEIQYKWNTPFRIKDRDDNGIFTEVIWHPATLSDLHKWLHPKFPMFWQSYDLIFLTKPNDADDGEFLWYNCSKDLLYQTPEVLDKIIELIHNNS